MTFDAFEVTAVVEIPLGSAYKYEVDKKTGVLTVDRPLPIPMPYNYGYIPGTLHGDGDPLDICIIGRHPIQPLAQVKVIILGAFLCNDNGDSDDKLVACVVGEDFPSDFLWATDEIKDYLESYKSGFKVKEWVDAEAAYGILMKDIDAYQNS